MTTTSAIGSRQRTLPTTKRTVVAAFAAVILVAWFIAAPWIALGGMKQAIQERDADRLAEYVDFPSVRQSLKDQLNAVITDSLADSSEDNPMTALGVALGGAMVDRMVESLVTPDGLARIYEGKSPLPMEAGTGADATQPIGEVGYESWDKFVVDIGEGGNQVNLILRQRGLGWALTAINLPKPTATTP
jgi:hypothetical protein